MWLWLADVLPSLYLRHKDIKSPFLQLRPLFHMLSHSNRVSLSFQILCRRLSERTLTVESLILISASSEKIMVGLIKMHIMDVLDPPQEPLKKWVGHVVSVHWEVVRTRVWDCFYLFKKKFLPGNGEPVNQKRSWRMMGNLCLVQFKQEMITRTRWTFWTPDKEGTSLFVICFTLVKQHWRLNLKICASCQCWVES